MRLAEILRPENVKLPIQADEKLGAIGELIDLLDANGDLTDPAQVRQDVLERERVRSTGIGNGLAIPHGKSSGVERLVVAFGRTAAPVEFMSVDARPVNVIWLLSSPLNRAGPHIQALARISKIMAEIMENPGVYRSLLDATTPREMFDVVIEQDERL